MGFNKVKLFGYSGVMLFLRDISLIKHFAENKFLTVFVVFGI